MPQNTSEYSEASCSTKSNKKTIINTRQSHLLFSFSRSAERPGHLLAAVPLDAGRGHVQGQVARVRDVSTKSKAFRYVHYNPRPTVVQHGKCTMDSISPLHGN